MQLLKYNIFENNKEANVQSSIQIGLLEEKRCKTVLIFTKRVLKREK